MINMTVIVGIFTIIGVITASFFTLNSMIDEKVSAMLDSREFLRNVVEHIQPQFLIFDDTKKILHKSKSIAQYVDLTGFEIEGSGENIKSIKIKTLEYIDFPPILTSLDDEIYFHEPERDGLFFVYNSVERAGAWFEDGGYVNKPAARFKLDFLIQ